MEIYVEVLRLAALQWRLVISELMIFSRFRLLLDSFRESVNINEVSTLLLKRFLGRIRCHIILP